MVFINRHEYYQICFYNITKALMMGFFRITRFGLKLLWFALKCLDVFEGFEVEPVVNFLQLLCMLYL